MIKKYPSKFCIPCAILDGLIVVFAMMLANVSRPFFSSFISSLANIQAPIDISIFVYVFSAIVWVIVLACWEIYIPEKNFRVVDEVYRLFMGMFISLVIIAGFLYFLNSQTSRLLFLIFGLITFNLQLLFRFILRWIRKNHNSAPQNKQRILIIGAGLIGRKFQKEINGYAELGYEFVGFLDDDPKLVNVHKDVLGSTTMIRNMIEEYEVDHLVIALPRRAYQRINLLVEEVHTLPVRVWVIPDYFALMLSKASIENFAGLPMINLRTPALTTRQRVTKRIIDFVLTVPIFIISLPLLGFIALLIKYDSDGPIFYRSTRLKENGETFEMLKFRTMVPNAHALLSKVIKRDENGNLNHKHPDDPRVTKIGKFLRKTSLDELPQLINILKGDMSLIGPRPELPEMVKLYEPWQYKRFTVPQGLTGWWQVNGRSDKPMHLHTEEDLYYIQNYSIWLDLQILIKTVLIVLRGKGAY